jgi:hypothetical protein
MRNKNIIVIVKDGDLRSKLVSVAHGSYIKEHSKFKIHIKNLKQCFIGHQLVKVSPMAVIEMKMMKKGNKVVTIRLIQWSKKLKEDATWEDLEEL